MDALGLGTEMYDRVEDGGTDTRENDDECETSDPEAVQVDRLLDVMADEGCRAVMDVTARRPLTASEVADRTDLALATTYRKLETLTELALLEERVRLRSKGAHACEYTCIVDEVLIVLPPSREFRLRFRSRSRALEPPALVH